MAQKEYNNFQLLVRAFSQYIKSYHHLLHTNCSPNSSTPRRFQKIKRDLEKFVCPAFPSETTQLLSKGNAANWTYTTLQILEENYKLRMEEACTKIDSLQKDDWERAWAIAIKWVKKDLLNVRQTTLIEAGKKFRDRMAAINPNPNPNLGISSNLNPNLTPSLGGHLTEDRSLPQPTLPTSPRPKRFCPGLDTHHQQDTSDSITLFTETVPSVEPPEQSDGTPLGSDLLDKWSTLFSPTFPVLPPLPQRTQQGGPSRTLPLEPEELHLYQRHEHGGDKNHNWFLTPTRSILIIGDSNIAKLPQILDDRVQVDCYPGANLSQAKHLLRHNTTGSNGVSKIILSFGINNRNQGISSLLKKDLNEVLEGAKKAFPQAEVFIPLINFSDDLPISMRSHIKVLNYLIKETNRSIPRLAYVSFNTESDNIHWTPDTGKKMWDHWKAFLG